MEKDFNHISVTVHRIAALRAMYWLWRSFLYLLCVVVFVLTNSCKKSATFSGSVLNFFSCQPLADVPVVLDEKKFGAFFVQTDFDRPSWKTNTDANGKFAFNIKAYKKRREYSLRIDYSDLPDTVEQLQKVFAAIPLGQEVGPLDEDGGKDIQFTAAPSARVIIYLEHTSNDPVDKWENAFVLSGEDFYINGTLSDAVKLPVPKVTTTTVPCDGKAVLKFTKVSSGVTTIQVDTVIVKPFELVRHRFFY